MMAYDYSPFEVEAILTTLAPMNWIVMGMSIVHAGLVYQGSTASLLSGTIFLFAVAWNNYLVAVAGLNAPLTTTVLGTLGALLLQIPLLKPQILKVILNRNLRWWRTPLRKRADIRTLIRPVLGGELTSRTFDLSKEGAFIRLDQASWDPLQKGSEELLKIGSRCSVRLMIDPFNTIQCDAEVVRHSNASGHYPGGFAIRFKNLDPNQRKVLLAYVHAPAGAKAKNPFEKEEKER